MRIFLACGVSKIEQCQYRDLVHKHKGPPTEAVRLVSIPINYDNRYEGSFLSEIQVRRVW